jgi:hypothetical protein
MTTHIKSLLTSLSDVTAWHGLNDAVSNAFPLRVTVRFIFETALSTQRLHAALPNLENV